MNTSPSIQYLCTTSPVGALLMAADNNGLCAILLADSSTDAHALLQERFPQTGLQESTDNRLQADMSRLQAWLKDPGQPLELGLPLTPRGSAFQQQVWLALRQTQPGQMLSYRQLAEQLGKPGASRAVASACAANPLALVIPCHRIVRSDGSLSGYRWGIARKQQLLRMEQEAMLAQAS
ncbi:MAG: methylated-DNA--[protein]-cysteine S-methyltransferase [Pseudomonadaceae bacterium]|nr:MAG: methylated-DNA--[protein]-cysteine S-methyltransferase [Pseudomonadaceae bacterium]